jgi:hypothetical protein
VDTDSYSETVLSWDKMTGGNLGTFSPVGIAIDNQITMPAPYNTTDNVFIWPVVQIGPSPTAGMQRVYVCGRNNVTHVGSTTYLSENVYIAYADFDTAMLEAGTALTWNHTTVPDLDAWNHDASGSWRRANLGFIVDDDGVIWLMGYHTAKTISTGAIIEEPDLIVFSCDNYGQGTWSSYTASGKIPSWNPPTQNGTGPGYFAVTSDDNLYWKVTDSGHINAVHGENEYLHFFGMWNLMSLQDGIETSYLGMNCIKEVAFNSALYQFFVREVYPQAGTSADTLYWQPWDQDGNHEVDIYVPSTGDPSMATDWNYPYWSNTVHNNAMAYQYNNFKITEPNDQGWTACVWQNSKRARLYNEDDIPQYQPYANAPEIFISISEDYGLNWSQPIVINSVEVAQFAGNIPMYVYPANTIKNMGIVNGHPTGRLGIMYYHDTTWGSYNVSPAVGPNDGGAVKFMSIDIDMSSLIGSGVSGTVINIETQQPIVNAVISSGTASATSGASGNYNLHLLPGVYDVTATAQGFAAVTVQDVTVTTGQTTNLDFQLTPAVSVYGIVRSTIPSMGLSNANVTLTGVQMYEAVTDSVGYFYIPGVLPNQIYLYVIVREGYGMVTGTIHVLGNDYNMGNVYMQPSDNEDETEVIFTDKLLGANPNPFRDNTQFSFTLKQPSPIALEIYNVRGQLISHLARTDNAKGYNAISWDGRDSMGNSLASGVYFIRMKTDKYTGQQKVLLLK